MDSESNKPRGHEDDKQHAKTVRTKAAIQAAFVKLMNEKGFNALSVTDITREAKINRGTFYIHYVDKYDLLDQLKDETLVDIKKYLDKTQTPMDYSTKKHTLISYSAILDALNSVAQKRELLMALISDQGDPSFVLDVRAYLKQKIEEAMPPSSPTSHRKHKIREDYLDIILYDEILGVIIQWLKTGSQEPSEEIATLITETRFLSPFDLLNNYEIEHVGS